MKCIEDNDIPWENLKSVLFDSCNVMRGKYSGVEKRIRTEKAIHLVDIDGDSCHHIHNCAKKFTNSFGNYMSALHKNLYADFKCSTDLQELFREIGFLLASTYATCPKRFLAHRWLSIYTVSVDNFQKLDQIRVFYYGLLLKSDQALYKKDNKNIFDPKAQGRTKEINSEVSKKSD